MAERGVYGWDDTPATLSEYIEYRVEILEQMGIRLTATEISGLNKLTNQTQVDGRIRSLMNKYW